MYVVQKIIKKAIVFTRREMYRRQTYDRWANLLVRSCWEFLFRWRNLGLLPFRICRRVSVAGVRMAADLGTIVVFELCFTLLGLVPRTRCLRLATAGAPGVC